MSVCYTDPGFEVDAVLRSDLATLYRMWEGEIELLDAVRAGTIELTGARWISRGLPRWLQLSPVAPNVRPPGRDPLTYFEDFRGRGPENLQGLAAERRPGPSAYAG